MVEVRWSKVKAWLTGLLALGLAGAALATKPDEGAVVLPDAFRLTYEVTPGGPGPTGPDRTSRLEAVWEGGKGRLSLEIARMDAKQKTTIDPWPSDAVTSLWRLTQGADLFRFKPEEGPAAPDFGSRRLACKATFGRLANEADFHWSSPLKNDRAVWPLIDHLDRLMTSTPPVPLPSVQPGQSGIIPVPPASTPGDARPVGEIEMLIALETTHLPIACDEASIQLQQTLSRGPLFAQQKPRIEKAIGVLSQRIEKNPKDAELRSIRGAFYYDLGDFDRAVVDFGQAIKLQPHQADHYNNRGSAHLRAGRKKEALADFGEALERGRERFGHLQETIRKLKGH